MSSLNQNRVAHRRWARGPGRLTTSRSYMKGQEFKDRQMWLPFTDAVGIALQALVEVKAAAWAKFQAWKRERWQAPRMPVHKPLQLMLFNMIGLQTRLGLH